MLYIFDFYFTLLWNNFSIKLIVGVLAFNTFNFVTPKGFSQNNFKV